VGINAILTLIYYLLEVPAMTLVTPAPLKSGDTLRIIAPSQSLSLLSRAVQDTARQRLESLGFSVTFGEHVGESDDFESTTIESRAADLHAAFLDPAVQGILTVIGGYNCNQLLSSINWGLIRENPKVFCGFSDITALNNAILAKSGLITYSGLHYSSFGEQKGFDYSLTYFRKAVMEKGGFTVEASAEWSDDAWYRNQEERCFEPNEGYAVINPGSAEGRIVGGNLCTLNLLQGTEYMPSLADSIVFLEDDDESSPVHFDRDLQSLIHQPEFEQVKGVVIGRFQKKSAMTPELLRQIIASKNELASLPVIAGADFGHTTPRFTFPVGGRVEIQAAEQATIRILAPSEV
jgi:muramoyltetrapeptide carboxypeptidase